MTAISSAFHPSQTQPNEQLLLRQIYGRDIGLVEIAEDYPLEFPEYFKSIWAYIKQRELALDYKSIISRNGKLLIELISSNESKLLREKLIEFLNQSYAALVQTPRTSVEFTRAYDQLIKDADFEDWELELVGAKSPFISAFERKNLEFFILRHLRVAPATRRSRELADAESVLKMIEEHKQWFASNLYAPLLQKLKRKRVFAAPGKDLYLAYCGDDVHTECRYRERIRTKEDTLDHTYVKMTHSEKPYFSKKIRSYSFLMSRLAELQVISRNIGTLFRQLEKRHPNDQWEFFQMLKKRCASFEGELQKFKAAKAEYCGASPELQKYVDSSPCEQKRIRKEYSARQVCAKFAATRMYLFYELLPKRSCINVNLIDLKELEEFIALVEANQNATYLLHLSSKLDTNFYVNKYDIWEKSQYVRALDFIAARINPFISNRE